MALSKRLSAIVDVVDSGYDEIWDCCCDHGLLGIELLQQNKAQLIHFVDIVPELMQALNDKLVRFATNEQCARWQVHCQDVAMISPDPNKRHLVIIAGVGGELLVQFLAKIVGHHPGIHIDFIVCPVHHSYQVRRYLQTLSLGLVSEQLICENKRFYEIIAMSASSSKQVTRVGQQMWQLTSKEHQAYLKQLCAHYQRMLNQDAAYYQPVLDEYSALLL
ncbi:tRNA (adenine(22)-N(1))-methyltransferase TrmK [Pseudoalteromonas sp. SCSIO 43101]|uniref:tRNA (adenine(22)-N(1))-methyltransferase n=1 Tax=Pseudoalteromonas sp. SCSIO 43101 TaxID=2822847 RepID=UPI00202B778F|nr:tRNA (adenine(22)-N(1))-methyltransferase TrmK [Pseudoalteromonas sp. SCSIO 43101]URQ91617.1 tRNA (adenine(22)-N(1))-methyltransferase TrmK [Pseudoalteromonas sp. SCSIO 43101]